MTAKTTKKNMTIFRQVCELIPTHLVSQLAREHKIKSRDYSPWSHVVTHLYVHLFRVVGLNDACDSLGMNSTKLRAIRGATPPKRNTLSNANTKRDSDMAKALYWRMLEVLQKTQPSFAQGGKRQRGYLKRFKTVIHAVDSTTIQLVANCMPWAEHRRRKAAAKCHMNLNLSSMLPHYAVVDTAKEADAKRAWNVCAWLRKGEIVVFDRAYLAYDHLYDLTQRGVFWVTRAKKNSRFKVLRRLKTTRNSNVIRDEIVELKAKTTRKNYPETFRRVEVRVEIDGKQTVMVFLTNNIEWSAWSVAELYRARWEIEVFFKELKQTLKLVDFIGYSKNAVEWQIWTGLLVHLLMRFMAHLSQWGQSFTRLFSLLRSGLWHNYGILSLLESYGTAGPPFRICACPNMVYLPGFEAPDKYPMGQPKRRKSKQAEKYAENLQGKIKSGRENTNKKA